MVQLNDTMFEFWKSCLRAQVNSNSVIVFELITVDGNCHSQRGAITLPNCLHLIFENRWWILYKIRLLLP